MYRFRCINTRRKKDNATKNAQKNSTYFHWELKIRRKRIKESTEGKTPNRESKKMNKMRHLAESIGICTYILDVVSVFLIKTCERINIVFYQVASHLKSRRTYKTICLEAKDNPSPPGHSSDDISIFFCPQ